MEPDPVSHIASRAVPAVVPRATTSHRGNKRARLVCLRCHEKKTKCDLQARGRNGSRQCTNCTLAESECQLRASRRGGPKDGHDSSNHHHVAGLEDRATLVPLPRTFNSEPVFSEEGFLPRGNLNSTDDPASSSHHLIAGENQPGPEVSNWGYCDHGDFRPPEQPIEQVVGDKSPFNGNVTDQAMLTSPERHLSNHGETTASYLGRSGFLRIFSQDSGFQSTPQSSSQKGESQDIDKIPSALQESFRETYFEFCYPWCPVIENDPQAHAFTSDSLFLRHAFALLGSQINPSILKHATPEAYYDRAKALFYASHEQNPLACISALILFYWWGGGPPNTISIDTVWWWTGVAIRQAQQLGLHREVRPGQTLRPGETPGLRRRIWWILFARERLSSLCQGRPCIIDPDDCNIRELTIEDFPEPRDSRAEIFIYWVRLCAIIGRVAKFLRLKTESTPFPVILAKELIAWVQSLPPHLQLHIETDHTSPFRREIHQLYLPYLTTITLLYLSPSAKPLPKAGTAAVLAASCVTRIFEDYLARGSIRFLHGMAGWDISIAILALLYARQVRSLIGVADKHIKILRVGLKEMAKLWHSSQMFDRGFERLLGSNAFLVVEGHDAYTPEVAPEDTLAGLADLAEGGGVELMDYFPFVTTATGPMVKILVQGGCEAAVPFTDIEWPTDFTVQLQDLFDNFYGGSDDVLSL